MRKLLTLTCALMLVSSMAFAKRIPASASSKTPADLVPFPDAGKGWVTLDIGSNGKVVKGEGEKTKARNTSVTPSVIYAFNSNIAATFDIGFVTGKELTWYNGKKKITGITNPTIGVVYRALDSAKNGNDLNIGLSVSPTFGKKVIKKSNATVQKANAISGQNVVAFDVAWSKNISDFAIGAEFGFTYNGQQKTKNKNNDPQISKYKASQDINVGINAQYKGVNKLALTTGIGYTKYGKIKTKGEDSYVAVKSFGQFALGLGANYNVCKNTYVGVNWDHAFKATAKVYDDESEQFNKGKVSGDSFGIGATYQF